MAQLFKGDARKRQADAERQARRRAKLKAAKRAKEILNPRQSQAEHNVAQLLKVFPAGSDFEAIADSLPNCILPKLSETDVARHKAEMEAFRNRVREPSPEEWAWEAYRQKMLPIWEAERNAWRARQGQVAPPEVAEEAEDEESTPLGPPGWL
jgi:hypothetical protein